MDRLVDVGQVGEMEMEDVMGAVQMCVDCAKEVVGPMKSCLLSRIKKKKGKKKKIVQP